jgi:hypothetical protein
MQAPKDYKKSMIGPIKFEMQPSFYTYYIPLLWIRLNFQLHFTEPASKLSLYYHPPSISDMLSDLQSISAEKRSVEYATELLIDMTRRSVLSWTDRIGKTNLAMFKANGRNELLLHLLAIPRPTRLGDDGLIVNHIFY